MYIHKTIINNLNTVNTHENQRQEVWPWCTVVKMLQVTVCTGKKEVGIAKVKTTRKPLFFVTQAATRVSPKNSTWPLARFVQSSIFNSVDCRCCKNDVWGKFAHAASAHWRLSEASLHSFCTLTAHCQINRGRIVVRVIFSTFLRYSKMDTLYCRSGSF